MRMDAARPRSVSGSGGVPPAAEVGGRGPEGVGTVRDSARPLDYASLVARATEALAATLGLPTFEAWRAAYEKAPEQFDAELLGFWKRKV